MGWAARALSARVPVDARSPRLHTAGPEAVAPHTTNHQRIFNRRLRLREIAHAPRSSDPPARHPLRSPHAASQLNSLVCRGAVTLQPPPLYRSALHSGAEQTFLHRLEWRWGCCELRLRSTPRYRNWFLARDGGLPVWTWPGTIQVPWSREVLNTII